jgi:hypothetical protein
MSYTAEFSSFLQSSYAENHVYGFNVVLNRRLVVSPELPAYWRMLGGIV